MTKGLWLKKVWNGRSKGLSTILGTVFLTLVIFAISTNVFIWTLSQNAQYTQTVKDENQKNVDRQSEHLIASGTNYSVSGDEVTVKVTLRNAGSVAAQVINLWVFDTTEQKYTNKSLNLNLNPGEALPLIGSSSLKVNLSGANASHEFASYFVTARGNTIPLTSTEDIIVAELAQGIGSIAMEFYTFRYFEYEGSKKLANYPSGIVSFDVPSSTNVAFGCRLTNLDPRRQPIIFDSHSLLWIFQPVSSVPHSTWWYLVNVADDGTISSTFSPITIAYGETKLLVFASDDDVGTSGFGRQKTPSKALSVPVFLLLHGTIGGAPYGQNIPFVSLYID
ncbi:MAG: hypothetical protein ACE5L6_01050 [Candidatus Bathyarchaeia archaeon]